VETVRGARRYQDDEFSGLTGGMRPIRALQLLDGDMPQYIHDNTDDEIVMPAFLRIIWNRKALVR